MKTKSTELREVTPRREIDVFDIRCQLSWPVSDNYLVRLVVTVL